MVWIDGAQSSGTGCHVALGIHVVPKGSDATLLISPLTEAEADWFVYQTSVLSYEELVVDAVPAFGTSGYRFDIDSKVMRKMKPGEEIQVVITQLTIPGQSATAINAAGQLRFLLGT